MYLLAPHASSLQTGTTKFRQDFVGPMVIESRIDHTHYRFKDARGKVLADTYHINRLKRAKVNTVDGVATNHDQLKLAMGVTPLKAIQDTV